MVFSKDVMPVSTSGHPDMYSKCTVNPSSSQTRFWAAAIETPSTRAHFPASTNASSYCWLSVDAAGRQPVGEKRLAIFTVFSGGVGVGSASCPVSLLATSALILDSTKRLK